MNFRTGTHSASPPADSKTACPCALSSKHAARTRKFSRPQAASENWGPARARGTLGSPPEVLRFSSALANSPLGDSCMSLAWPGERERKRRRGSKR